MKSQKIIVTTFGILVLVMAGSVYFFSQKPTTGTSDKKDDNTNASPANFIGIIHNAKGEEVIEHCFLENTSSEFSALSTEDWVPREYYTQDHTVRFLLSPDYSLRVDGDSKYILTNNSAFEKMKGSITTNIEDFSKNNAYYTGYRNDYGIAYFPQHGWTKQYVSAGQIKDYATCKPNPYLEIEGKKIFRTTSRDAGAVSESYIMEMDGKIIIFDLSYVLGGDAADGLDLPSDPERVALSIRNVVLTLMSTLDVSPSTL